MSHTTPSDYFEEPHLAPPGAGLPTVELFIGRLLFALRCRTGNRHTFTASFQKERAAIRALLESASKFDHSRRVLIERPIGLEDSSRFWSLWMTLDHLRIVNLAIAGIIRSLGAGTVPPGQASTAAVKPTPEAGASVVQEYENSCEEVLAAADAVRDIKTSHRYIHPWFGPMDAHAWYALAGSHLGIHKVQMERIIAGLRTS